MDKPKLINYRVLLVDDDPSSSKLLNIFFSSYDRLFKVGKTALFETEPALDGIDAVAKLESRPYDIVILDVSMKYRELSPEFISQSREKCDIFEYPYLLDLCRMAWAKNPNAKVGLYSSEDVVTLKKLADALGVKYYQKNGDIKEIARSHVSRITP